MVIGKFIKSTTRGEEKQNIFLKKIILKSIIHNYFHQGNTVLIRRNQTFDFIDYKCIPTATFVSTTNYKIKPDMTRNLIFTILCFLSKVHEFVHIWQTQNTPMSVSDTIWLFEQQINNRRSLQVDYFFIYKKFLMAYEVLSLNAHTQ